MATEPGSNLRVSEGTLLGESTISFDIRFRVITITNDSGSTEMTYKFNTTETASTLKPSETISLKIKSKDVILSGSNVDYRIVAVA